jgi:hypothetical protein
MGVTTWLDRITDETNVWLSAVKAEEAEDLETAATLFINDAATCLGSGSLVRAALSCSCAADCLSRAGAVEPGKRLYFEAGVMYSDTAEAMFSSSTREALWSLRRAYECFVLAEDVKESERARESFALLARRANPFVTGTEGFELPKVRPVARTSVQVRVSTQAGSPVAGALDRFLGLRLKAGRAASQARPLQSSRRPEVEFLDQESIAGQLG